MLKNNLDVTYAIVWLLALANVVGTLICIAASGGIARLTTIPFRPARSVPFHDHQHSPRSNPART